MFLRLIAAEVRQAVPPGRQPPVVADTRCRSRPFPRPIGAICRAPQAKYRPEHGNVVRDWERSQSRVKISMGGEEARHSWELLHHLLGCVVSYTSSSPGASAAREVFRWVRSREFLQLRENADHDATRAGQRFKACHRPQATGLRPQASGRHPLPPLRSAACHRPQATGHTP